MNPISDDTGKEPPPNKDSNLFKNKKVDSLEHLQNVNPLPKTQRQLEFMKELSYIIPLSFILCCLISVIIYLWR